MEWKDAYAIGVKEIDSQHRELVDMVTRLENALSTDQEKQEIGNLLKFLVDYTKRHFSAEEEIMMDSGYPELSRHKELHKTLIDEVTGVLIGLKKGQSIDPKKIASFLRDWLVNHILDEDKKIGEHISQKDQTNGASDFISPLHLPELMEKFEKIKTLFTQKLISEQDHLEKKSHFLNDLGTVRKDDEEKDILKRFEFISDLFGKKLITKDEAKTSKAMIIEHYAVDDLLSGIPNIDDRFHFLKSLLEEGILPSEKYDELKSKLLMDI